MNTQSATLLGAIGLALAVSTCALAQTVPSRPTGHGQQTYTVKEGDTLSQIGRQFGRSATVIISANNLTADIKVGQVLTIPAYTEDRPIYGQTKSTPELHNHECNSNDGCVCIGDKKWCYKPTELTVEVPDKKWVFYGSPVVQCVKDNQGSAEWNRLGAADMTTIKLNNPDKVVVEILTGSRSIDVRLVCNARYYP